MAIVGILGLCLFLSLLNPDRCCNVLKMQTFQLATHR